MTGDLELDQTGLLKMEKHYLIFWMKNNKTIIVYETS